MIGGSEKSWKQSSQPNKQHTILKKSLPSHPFKSGCLHYTTHEMYKLLNSSFPRFSSNSITSYSKCTIRVDTKINILSHEIVKIEKGYSVLQVTESGRRISFDTKSQILFVDLLFMGSKKEKSQRVSKLEFRQIIIWKTYAIWLRISKNIK